MASYTGNLGLKKPALDDDALITDINNNMDIVDAAINGIQDGLAIVANNNTHVAITAGQFVYVRNHSTLTEGLYVASTNIAANATLSSSNLTADAAGGLNSLNSKIIPTPSYSSVGQMALALGTPVSYTFPNDCWACAIFGLADSDHYINIGDITILAFGQGQTYFMFPVKAGTIVTLFGTSSYATYLYTFN